MVLIQLNCKPITHRQILLFNKSNWDAITSGLNSFYHDLLNVDITNVNVNTLWIQFCDALLGLIDSHIQCKIARKKCDLGRCCYLTWSHQLPQRLIEQTDL